MMTVIYNGNWWWNNGLVIQFFDDAISTVKKYIITWAGGVSFAGAAPSFSKPLKEPIIIKEW